MAQVTVQSKGNWSVTTKPSWASIIPSSGTAGTQQITVLVGSNFGDLPRSGEVVFTGKDDHTAILEIRQDGFGQGVLIYNGKVMSYNDKIVMFNFKQ